MIKTFDNNYQICFKSFEEQIRVSVVSISFDRLKQKSQILFLQFLTQGSHELHLWKKNAIQIM